MCDEVFWSDMNQCKWEIPNCRVVTRWLMDQWRQISWIQFDFFFKVACGREDVNVPAGRDMFLCSIERNTNNVEQSWTKINSGSLILGCQQNQFYLLAYLSVFKVFSHDAIPGEMVAICAGEHSRVRSVLHECFCPPEVQKHTQIRLQLTMHVLEFSPMKESLSTWVNLLALNGVWGLFRPRARIHSCRKTEQLRDYKNSLQ